MDTDAWQLLPQYVSLFLIDVLNSNDGKSNKMDFKKAGNPEFSAPGRKQ